MVTGCWLVEDGYSCDDALSRINELRKETSDFYARSPETDEQETFIRNWPSPPT